MMRRRRVVVGAQGRRWRWIPVGWMLRILFVLRGVSDSPFNSVLGEQSTLCSFASTSFRQQQLQQQKRGGMLLFLSKSLRTGDRKSMETRRTKMRHCPRISIRSMVVNDSDATAAAATTTTTTATTEVVEPPHLKSQPLPPLTDAQVDFCCGYLNQHHGNVLLAWVDTCTALGSEVASANAWTGGQMRLSDARLTHVNRQSLTLDVTVHDQRRKQRTSSSASTSTSTSTTTSTRTVVVDVNAQPIRGKQRQFPPRPVVPEDAFVVAHEVPPPPPPQPMRTSTSRSSTTTTTTTADDENEENNVTDQNEENTVTAAAAAAAASLTSSSSSSTIASFARQRQRSPIQDWCRRVARLCWLVGFPEVSGKLAQLAWQLEEEEKTTGTDTTTTTTTTNNNRNKAMRLLPPNLYLNQVPYNRYVRQYFYDQASQAVLDAVWLWSNRPKNQNQKKNKTTQSSSSSSSVLLSSPRMQVVAQFPELNPGMDSYRIGTLLELTRAIALTLVEAANVRVRICVQQSLGVGIFTGMPKSLGGVAQLLQRMDWASGAGEVNEGVLGQYVNFGAIGKDHVVNEVRVRNLYEEGTAIVQHADDVFLLVAPQNMVGTDSSIVPYLQEMVHAAGDRPVILINPDLSDKVSAQGQQSVRGRQERLDFVASFATVYCFQNIYVSGTSYFPILGAMTKSRPHDPWIAYQRRDLAAAQQPQQENIHEEEEGGGDGGGGGDSGGELYVPVLLSETRPDGQVILESFER